MQAVDSIDLHKKNRYLHQSSRPGGLMSSIVTTPQCYSDLYPDVHDTPPNASDLHSAPKPSFVQSSVYPQRSPSVNQVQTLNQLGIPSSPSSAKTPIQNQLPFPGNSSNLVSPQPVRDIQNPNQVRNLANTLLPTSVPNPNSFSTDVDPDLNLSNSLRNPIHGKSIPFGPHSPTATKSSPSRKLQQVFQQEGNRLTSEEKLSSIVRSLEDEMQNSGIKIDCTELKTQLSRLMDNYGKVGTVPEGGEGEHALKIDFNTQSKQISTEEQPKQVVQEADILAQKPVNNRDAGKNKNWAALFSAQEPSKVMKLEHYPELRRGKNAIVELDESHIDDRAWNHCLYGYFLDGRMPFALLRATAHTAWKDCAPVSIKQVGSCFFFEFKDEATKLKVLDGGPYFFSKRYLVLKDWRRMLIPSTDHPSSIPAWIKIHKLPLECWTEAGLSRIASSIGKPIHVDNATAKRQRLDFARVCVEIEAGDELPTEVQVIVNGESVVVHIEYQWLPSNCTKCKIFGHSTDSCTSKISHVPSTSGTSVQSGIKGQKPTEEEWQVIGRAAALEKGGITALEAVTKFVPITSDTSLGGIKSDVPLSDNESETPDEEFVVDSPPAIPELTAAMAKEVPKIPQPPNSDMEDSTWVVDPGINKAIGTSQGGGIGAATSQPNSSKSSSSSKKKKNNKRYSQGSNQGGKKSTPLQKREAFLLVA
jgi:hypothetical protein